MNVGGFVPLPSARPASCDILFSQPGRASCTSAFFCGFVIVNEIDFVGEAPVLFAEERLCGEAPTGSYLGASNWKTPLLNT